MQLRPNDASGWYHLAVCCLEQDDVEEALAHLRRALALDPELRDDATFDFMTVAEDEPFRELLRT